MKKNEFLKKLREQLWALPAEDAERSCDYYSEMIDDRMDEGLTEEEAVAAIGDLEEIVKQILTETPRPPVVVERSKVHKDWKIWTVVLLVLGAPVWVPVVAAVLAVLLTAYLLLWTAVAVLYCAVITTGVSAFAGVIGSVAVFVGGRLAEAAVMLGVGFVCAGLSVLLFMVSNLAAKGMILFTKGIFHCVKRIFTGKEHKA